MPPFTRVLFHLTAGASAVPPCGPPARAHAWVGPHAQRGVPWRAHRPVALGALQGLAEGYRWRPPLPLHQALVERHQQWRLRWKRGAFFQPSSKKVLRRCFDVVLVESDALRTLFPWLDEAGLGLAIVLAECGTFFPLERLSFSQVTPWGATGLGWLALHRVPAARSALTGYGCYFGPWRVREGNTKGGHCPCVGAQYP